MSPAAAPLTTYRRIVTASSLYSVVMFVQRAASLILLPVYTRYLKPADYGVLELLDLLSSVIAILVGARLGQALFYYYHDAGEDTPSSYVSSAMIGSLLIGGAVAAICILASAPLSGLIFGTSDFTRHIQVFALGFGFSLSIEVGWCYLRVTDQPRLLVTISVCRVLAMFILNPLLLIAQMGVLGVLWGNTIATMGVAIYLLWNVWSTISLKLHRRVFLKLMRFSAPLGLSAIADMILHFGDRFFLRTNVSLSTLGLYGLGYKLGMIVPQISTPFFMYWNSQMLAIVRQPGGERMYARVATYLILCLTGLTLGLVFFSNAALQILTTPEFHAAAIFVPWIALAYLIRAIGAYCANTFLIERKPGLVAQVNMSGAAVCLIGYAILIPKMGVWGAIIATLLGFTVMAGLSLWRSQKVRRFDFEYGRWAKIEGAAALPAAAWFALQPADVGMQILIGTLLLGAFVLLLLAMGFVQPDEKTALARLSRSMRDRLPGARPATTP